MERLRLGFVPSHLIQTRPIVFNTFRDFAFIPIDIQKNCGHSKNLQCFQNIGGFKNQTYLDFLSINLLFDEWVLYSQSRDAHFVVLFNSTTLEDALP
ncbi:MAG: hypothetical protein B6247_21860 [Candidatus Parabeggiatoa sp. nov. 2]|nr:MAG: hypothetical protein B6247_21860 [Beggiatoa sp. 4572_84]